MRKLLLIASGMFILTSCGKEKEMLKEYQSKNVKALNFDLKDLDFKINSIEKVGEIKASDSMLILKKELAESWVDDPSKEMIDTINFPFVIKALKDAVESSKETYQSYQELTLSAIRRGDYLNEYTYSSKRDESLNNMEKFQNNLNEIKRNDSIYKHYENIKESIISTKYKASYSINNPMLGNARQTFEKYFYSNKENTKFIKEESIE